MTLVLLTQLPRVSFSVLLSRGLSSIGGIGSKSPAFNVIKFLAEELIWQFHLSHTTTLLRFGLPPIM